MSISLMVGLIFGAIAFWVALEVTRTLISRYLSKREERKLEEVVKKSLDFFQSPEYQELRKEYLRSIDNLQKMLEDGMFDDDLYKSVH